MLTFDQLCGGLEAEVSAFAICEVRQDATFVLSEDEHSAIHYVLSGTGSAWRDTGELTELVPETVMIVPPGTRLTITADPERKFNFVEPKCEPLAGGWDLLTVGDGPPGLTLACGYVHAHYMQVTKLFDYLRAPLIENVSEVKSFREPFHNLLNELAEPQPGTKVLAAMLMKQCLISLLRVQSETTGECFVPWLAALGNQSLGRALAAMLDSPEANHTLESLGNLAGMSRAAFAERFKEAFGRTAIDCLKEIRLRRAAHLLTATDLPIKTIAIRVGFESRSYFSRAFKDFAGIDPAGFRANPDSGSLKESGERDFSMSA
ncbi:MAG: AraC family transcriptional regulator [Alphaproteobacteria bacterium]|nr:AraC family transcriptional regulator [Alphaproteobacteria bacterium]